MAHDTGKKKMFSQSHFPLYAAVLELFTTTRSHFTFWRLRKRI